MKTTDYIQIGIAAIGLGFTIYTFTKTKQAAEKLKESLDITSDKNLAYQGVNAVVGEERFASAADKFFDFFNPDIKAEREKNQRGLTK